MTRREDHDRVGLCFCVCLFVWLMLFLGHVASVFVCLLFGPRGLCFLFVFCAFMVSWPLFVAYYNECQKCSKVCSCCSFSSSWPLVFLCYLFRERGERKGERGEGREEGRERDTAIFRLKNLPLGRSPSNILKAAFQMTAFLVMRKLARTRVAANVLLCFHVVRSPSRFTWNNFNKMRLWWVFCALRFLSFFGAPNRVLLFVLLFVCFSSEPLKDSYCFCQYVDSKCALAEVAGSCHNLSSAVEYVYNYRTTTYSSFVTFIVLCQYDLIYDVASSYYDSN